MLNFDDRVHGGVEAAREECENAGAPRLQAITKSNWRRWRNRAPGGSPISVADSWEAEPSPARDLPSGKSRACLSRLAGADKPRPRARLLEGAPRKGGGRNGTRAKCVPLRPA